MLFASYEHALWTLLLPDEHNNGFRSFQPGVRSQRIQLMNLPQRSNRVILPVSVRIATEKRWG